MERWERWKGPKQLSHLACCATEGTGEHWEVIYMYHQESHAKRKH